MGSSGNGDRLRHGFSVRHAVPREHVFDQRPLPVRQLVPPHLPTSVAERAAPQGLSGVDGTHLQRTIRHSLGATYPDARENIPEIEKLVENPDERVRDASRRALESIRGEK